MPATYEPIEAKTLSATTSTVTFSSIPQTYTDLVLVVTGVTDHSNSGARGYIRFNGDTAQNYGGLYLQWDNSSQVGGSDTTEAYLSYGRMGNSGISTAEINIMSYTNTSVFKSCVTRQSSSDAAHSRLTFNVWRSTSAINSITLVADDNYVSGTTLNLWGIKAA